MAHIVQYDRDISKVERHVAARKVSRVVAVTPASVSGVRITHIVTPSEVGVIVTTIVFSPVVANKTTSNQAGKLKHNHLKSLLSGFLCVRITYSLRDSHRGQHCDSGLLEALATVAVLRIGGNHGDNVCVRVLAKCLLRQLEWDEQGRREGWFSVTFALLVELRCLSSSPRGCLLICPLAPSTPPPVKPRFSPSLASGYCWEKRGDKPHEPACAEDNGRAHSSRDRVITADGVQTSLEKRNQTRFAHLHGTTVSQAGDERTAWGRLIKCSSLQLVNLLGRAVIQRSHHQDLDGSRQTG